jgi:hypothetical protein
MSSFMEVHDYVMFLFALSKGCLRGYKVDIYTPTKGPMNFIKSKNILLFQIIGCLTF